MQYVKRSGRNRIDELFSDRALLILSELRKLILEVENEEIQNLLLFCFTSMLSNVSRMFREIKKNPPTNLVGLSVNSGLLKFIQNEISSIA